MTVYLSKDNNTRNQADICNDVNWPKLNILQKTILELCMSVPNNGSVKWDKFHHHGVKKSATDKKHKNKNVELFLCKRNAMKNVNMFPKKQMIIIIKSMIPKIVTASGSGL